VVTVRDFPASKKAGIRTLHRLRPWWNLKILVLVGVWACAGWTALHVPRLPVRLVCWFLIGATIQGLVILMHEGVHRIMFRNRVANRWVAFVCGIPAALSVSAYRVGHLPHHRYERGARDPDELENVTTNPRILALLICLMFLGGEVFGFYRVGPTAVLHAARGERRAIFVEYAIIAAVFVAAFSLLPFPILVQLWLLPALFARQLTNVRTVAEHVLTGHGDPVAVTRTVTSNRFVSFFMCNLNYHLVHHLYPGVPWYHLPALHRLLGDELRRAGAPVYGGYLEFLRELAAFVWKAWRPGGTRLALTLPARLTDAGPGWASLTTQPGGSRCAQS